VDERSERALGDLAADKPILSVRDLRVHVVTRRGMVRTVDGRRELDLRFGENMCLVSKSEMGQGHRVACLRWSTV
jgi:hypothetical protein